MNQKIDYGNNNITKYEHLENGKCKTTSVGMIHLR